MFEINNNELVQALKALQTQHKNQWQMLDKVIRPFLSEKLSNKHVIELYQVGRFVTLLSQSANIVKHSDSPDFVISFNGDNIGPDHERVFNTN